MKRQPPQKDRRVDAFRSAALALVESLEAVVRLSRWGDADPPRASLVAAAAKIVERLAAADRLLESRCDVPQREATRLAKLRDAMKRLDAAYRAFRHKARGDADAAATALEHEVAAVGAGEWQ